MEIPDEIVESVKNGKCILFLGAMASAASPDGSPFKYSKTIPSAGQLSQALADKCHYPDPDVTNLQRVSLFYQFRPGGSRESLVQAIADEITKPDVLPSPALHMLAALPFPIVITTNYDHLFDIALSRANTLAGQPKQPIKRIYDPNRNGPPDPAHLKLLGCLMM